MERRKIEVKPEEFQLPDKVRKLIAYIDIYLDNYPYRYIQIKDRLANASYDMLQSVYKANKTDNIYVKLDLIDDIFASAQMIEYLINLSYDKKIINRKRVLKFGNSIGTITAMLTGWKRSALHEKRRLEKGFAMTPQMQAMSVIQKDLSIGNEEKEDELEELEVAIQEEEPVVEEKHKKKQEQIIENPKNNQLEKEYQKMELNFPKPSF